jgi:hypothetical protein
MKIYRCEITTSEPYETEVLEWVKYCAVPAVDRLHLEMRDQMQKMLPPDKWREMKQEGIHACYEAKRGDRYYEATIFEIDVEE